MAKRRAPVVRKEETSEAEEAGPQTFEEALELALHWLSEPNEGIPDDWLAALNREKESSSS